MTAQNMNEGWRCLCTAEWRESTTTSFILVRPSKKTAASQFKNYPIHSFSLRKLLEKRSFNTDPFFSKERPNHSSRMCQVKNYFCFQIGLPHSEAIMQLSAVITAIISLLMFLKHSQVVNINDTIVITGTWIMYLVWAEKQQHDILINTPRCHNISYCNLTTGKNIIGSIQIGKIVK